MMLFSGDLGGVALEELLPRVGFDINSPTAILVRSLWFAIVTEDVNS